MIRKTLFSALILLALYAAVIEMVPRFRPVTQHQWEGNQIKAQTYMYRAKDTMESVILGSSLASRMVMDSLAGFTNLAFSGQSIFDGLAIVSRMKTPPHRVFIEMNILIRGEDKNFTGALFNPVLYPLREHVPALRAGYEPLAIVGSGFTRVVEGVISMGKNRLVKKGTLAPQAAPVAPQVVSTVKVADPFFQHLLDIQVQNYSQLPDSATVEARLEILDHYVEMLTKKNVQVVFFEMPVDEHIHGLPLATYIREAFHREFPAGKYAYIMSPDCSGYQTSDGLHLEAPDAVRYTLYFRSRMNMPEVAVSDGK